MARPIRMTPERMRAVLAGIRLGQSHTQAALAAGISNDTLRRWLVRAPAFGVDVAQAEAECQQMLLKVVIAAAARNLPNTWQAGAWLLERRWPNEFGQKSRLDLTIDMQSEIRELAEQNGLAPEQIVAMAESIISQHVSEKKALD